MAVDGSELEMLMDSRLSADARVLGAFIAGKGPGFHEIPRDDFRDVLSADAGLGRIQRGLQQLEKLAWIERRGGGRGHSDAFSFRGRENETLSDSGVIPLPVNTFSGRTIAPLNAPVVVERELEEYPPIIPPFEQAIEKHGDLLVGCRDSMRDYISARVPKNRQTAYVHTVAGWLNDMHPGIWMRPDGSNLDREHRTNILAAAFNELAASDEAKMKRPVGDPANLAVKIEIFIKDWTRKHERRTGTDNRTATSRGQREARPDQSARRRAAWGD